MSQFVGLDEVYTIGEITSQFPWVVGIDVPERCNVVAHDHEVGDCSICLAHLRISLYGLQLQVDPQVDAPLVKNVKKFQPGTITQ